MGGFSTFLDVSMDVSHMHLHILLLYTFVAFRADSHVIFYEVLPFSIDPLVRAKYI